MNKTRMKALATIAALYAVTWTILRSDIAPLWLMEELRWLALVGLPAVTVAILLLAYFDWREKLVRRARANREALRNAG